MIIEVCIHCYNYQRRLTWMLSSILQQQGDVPEIHISVAFCENNGNPTTADVLSFFSERGLKIIPVVLKESQMHNRAISRNKRCKGTEADWIIFADSDMVYDVNFFSNLKKQLSGKLNSNRLVMGADRISLKEDFCINYFNNDNDTYPRLIDDVAKKISNWPVKWIKGKNKAPGFFQLANVNIIRENGGKYSRSETDFWRGTHSDRAFRVRMGGKCAITTERQWHLNHDRGGPEIQR